jgi:hypothetical protein
VVSQMEVVVDCGETSGLAVGDYRVCVDCTCESGCLPVWRADDAA